MDGVPRILSYRSMAGYPLMVTVGSASDEVLAPVMQRRVHLKNQKCEAVKLDITDVSVSGTDGGLSLSGLSFEIGVKKGLVKLGPARSY